MINKIFIGYLTTWKHRVRQQKWKLPKEIYREGAKYRPDGLHLKEALKLRNFTWPKGREDSVERGERERERERWRREVDGSVRVSLVSDILLSLSLFFF